LSKFTIRFLTRDQCPLCDAARPMVTTTVARYGGAVEEVDVDGSDDIKERFGDRIPVVLGTDGTVIAEGHIEKRDLRRGLRRLGRSGA
jgi:hypothetical protein